MDLTFAEMFSGIGGFRLGLERSGWKCVWANDNDKYANKVYKKKFGSEELVEDDIREVQAKTVPDCTLLTAGFPCQAFSVASKRKGFADTRGTLFFDIARVAEAKRPPFLLLENVKGLLSAKAVTKAGTKIEGTGGYVFARILQALDELGYLLEWQVLNSKHFGVPQNRERVFLIGHLGNKGGRQIFPIGTNGEVPSGKGEGEPESREEASTLEASYGKSKSMNNMVVAGALSGGGHSGGLHSQMSLIAHSVRSGGRGSLDRHAWDTVILSHSPRTNNPKLGGSGPLLSNKHSFTVDSTPHKLIENYRIRRLTPTECERLQGFPDGWTNGVSDTQRYKLLGNAVTVNVIEFLGHKLKECLN